MPLDRRITINVSTEGRRNEFGEYVEGSTISHGVWATRMDRSQKDIEDEGGTLTSSRRDYRVRWFPELAASPVALVEVVDDEVTFNVLNMIEETGRDGITRRRWLRISGVYSP